LQRHGAKIVIVKGFRVLILCGSLLLFSACGHTNHDVVDRLNSDSYAFHYRNIDSTRVNAEKALTLSADYSDGKAEALNNLAFVSLIKMDFAKACTQLTEAIAASDNQVEQLIADIQMMKLCQRKSENKNFYEYRERAVRRLKRINEERSMLTNRERARLIYAESEMSIVTSTYYYYVGLQQESIKAIREIDPNGDIQQDTAQMLNYLYMMGSGGLITAKSQDLINQQEFDYLMKCLLLAHEYHYEYWEANSSQALAELLSQADYRSVLIRDNYPSMMYLNPAGISDSILCLELANRALDRFSRYGDVYQIGGAYRTLASCYMSLNDYKDALLCLQMALESSKKLVDAPELIASIHEQMSVAYSAIGVKPQSDYNRNIYLDLQDMTRQDRYLESRADALDRESSTLDAMIYGIIFMIIVVLFLLYIFNHLNIKKSKEHNIHALLKPLMEWKDRNNNIAKNLNNKIDELYEIKLRNDLNLIASKRKNLEQRAKISLINSITPFIDRIANEVNRLKKNEDNESTRLERFKYISELTDKINEYNILLTQWIQLRQGEVSLHIESFTLQPLFDIVAKGKVAFKMKGVTLNVQPTDITVKADRILTLFMINTLADNARKYTSDAGSVTIYAICYDKFVEISIEDTGCGLRRDELSSIFDHKIYNGHGFGLLNCKGIIDKYRKMSTIFSVCQISAESQKGKGSRFFFRLPKGIRRVLDTFLILLLPTSFCFSESIIQRAGRYADSTYYSNINGNYQQALTFADSARKCLNEFYLMNHPKSRMVMVKYGSSSITPAEIKWLHDSVDINYDIILDVRNESAVAALALKKWDVYNYNNKVYTQLFKELSADKSLATYCHNMQQSQTNKNIAIVLLIILLLMIFPAYYLLYYRHRLYYRFCVERIKKINAVLLEDKSSEAKLKEIHPLTDETYPAPLQNIVSQIVHALKEMIDLINKQTDSIEMADDERRKIEYENNMLHISNSVLDNSLSTLKHETMYYPNRIRQLVDTDENNIDAISEVVDYYRDIYDMLSSQLMRQSELVQYHLTDVSVKALLDIDTELTVLGDKDLLKYMFDILIKLSGDKKLDVKVEPVDDSYLRFKVNMPNLTFTKQQCDNLFTPNIEHIPYLLCKQIVRDHSEFTNQRGCRILAEPTAKGIKILIMLPKRKRIYAAV
jgi:hypothetical protein